MQGSADVLHNNDLINAHHAPRVLVGSRCNKHVNKKYTLFKSALSDSRRAHLVQMSPSLLVINWEFIDLVCAVTLKHLPQH